MPSAQAASAEEYPGVSRKFEVSFSDRASAGELAQFDSRLLENFNFYTKYSTPSTQLRWAKAIAGGELAALVPVVQLNKRPATDMLRHSLRRWLGPTLGPFAKKTTLLVDTAFLAYDDASPFYRLPESDSSALKRQIVAALKKVKKVDAIWITEPVADSAWAAEEGFQQFYTLPMVHVELREIDDYQQYLTSLSKKRRRNRRNEQETFEQAGGAIERCEGPFSGVLLDELLGCLRESAKYSQFAVPYNDVLTLPEAFAAQQQTALVARVGKQVVGFMSFLRDGNRLMQCHGGLDYDLSHQTFAYHNLIAAAVELAIEQGARLLSMGPHNNETKRRAGSHLRPMVANLWNRNPLDALAAKKFFAKNFEVYRGELELSSAS